LFSKIFTPSGIFHQTVNRTYQWHNAEHHWTFWQHKLTWSWFCTEAGGTFTTTDSASWAHIQILILNDSPKYTTLEYMYMLYLRFSKFCVLLNVYLVIIV
jgi:hypothetical protein